MSLQVHLQEAKEAHINWLSQAKEIVESGSIQNVSVPVGDTECTFGKLFHGSLKSELDEESMEAIDMSHFLLHDMYKNIFDLFNGKEALTDDDKVRAQGYFESLEEISEALVEVLDSL